MLGVNEVIDRFIGANSVCWHGNGFRWEDDHVFDLKADDLRNKKRFTATLKMQVVENV